MKLRHSAAFALCSVLVLTLRPAPAGAAEPSREPEARTIELVVIGSAGDLKWLQSVVGPSSAPGASLSFSRLDHFEPVDVLQRTSGPNASLRCWIDLRERSHARVYFSARSGERFLLRDLELSGSFDELDRESLSQVLALSWSALLDDEQAGLSRQEAEGLLSKRTSEAKQPAAVASEAPPPRPRQDANPSHFDLRFQAFYAAEAFAKELWVEQGPGLAVSLGSAEQRRRISLWLGGQYRFPEAEQNAQIGVRLESVALRTGLALSLPLDADLESAQRELSARAGLGVDLTHLAPEPGSDDHSAALTPARWTSELVLNGSIGLSMRLNHGAAIGARLFVDALPRLAVYELQVGSATDTLVSPWHVRPGLALEIETR